MGSIDKKFGLPGVVAVLEGTAQLEGGNFGKLLVAQIMLFFLPESGKGGTGNGNRHVLPLDKKDAIDSIAVPGGDGSEQMHKSHLDGVCQHS